MQRTLRTGGVVFAHCHAVVFVLALAFVLIPFSFVSSLESVSPVVGLTACAEETGGVVLTNQEISDAIRWGVEHNRTPEDIQEDIDGLNNARGGSGPVSLPVELQSVDTPAGRVTATGSEASGYYVSQGRIEALRAEAETHKSALKTLETESAKWAGWEQVPLARATAAYQELKEAYGDLQADLLLIQAKVLLVNRKPTPGNFGWAYRDHSTYEGAMSAWRNRRDKLDDLYEDRGRAQTEYIERIQKMTDKNPKSAEGTSMMNRPAAMLDEIGRYQDMHREEIIRIHQQIQQEEELLRQLERRAKGSGGPPVNLPTEQTTKKDEGSNGDSSGDESGDDEASIDDLLKEFGADEEGSEGEKERTGLVNEEILVGIQGRFDAAVADFDRCYADFDVRLNGLSGMEPDVICSDAGLAAAFGCAENQLQYCESYYREAHDRIAAADRSVDWRQMRMESEIITSGDAAVSPMDQITIILINTKYDQTSEAAQGMRDMLASAAPGCDPDDLKNADTWISDEPQPPEDEWGPGTETGSSGDRGGDGDNEEVAEGVHFRKLTSPTVHSGGKTAQCTGGSLTITQTSNPVFPDEIWPGQNYHVEFSLTWETRGNDVEEVEVVGGAFFMDPANLLREEYNAFSAFRSFRFTFTTDNVDFSRDGGVITINYGGSIDCEDGSGTTGGTVIVQAYERVGN